MGQVQANTKRRTTITAPSTGTWALGKTIGAGSMGKVKLAKHSETGEQVRTWCFLFDRDMLQCVAT
jgi:hypothetical protein|tara:strand:- start:20354 stop:20551 length:198 start_codon:yes stop_codon:yes gene_type:complete